jgi:hypothetical protein
MMMLSLVLMMMRIVSKLLHPKTHWAGCVNYAEAE